MIKKEHGFTLIELIMVILLMGLISVFIGRFLIQAYQTFLTSNDIAEVEWQGFTGLERFINDVHTLRSPNDITGITLGAITFIDKNGNTVTYTRTGGTTNFLVRNSSLISGNILLASNIPSLSLSYLDQNGNFTSGTVLIRYIPITLTVVRGNISTTFSSMAAVRTMQ